MAVSITGDNIYILDITNMEKLMAQFVPMELNESRTADLTELRIIGRNEPRYQTTGGKTTVSFTLDFVGDTDTKQDVIANVKWLQQKTMNDGYAAAQPKLKIVFGKMFRNELWYLDKVDADYSLFDKSRGVYTMALVKVSFSQAPSTNPKWRDVRWT